MRTGKFLALAAIIICIAGQATVQAVFIVECHSTGWDSDHFSMPNGTPRWSVKSNALGCKADNSAFGGTVAPHAYVFSYTPGVDADNYSFAAGTVLGKDMNSVAPYTTVTASGLTGGFAPGVYNVYVTWPHTAGISGGTQTFTMTSEDGDVIKSYPQSLFNEDTAAPGADKWGLIGQVSLMPGKTYTVTMTPASSSYVSMRAQGVMWEFVQEAPSVATIEETDGATSVSENGDTDTYTIVLNEQPTLNTAVVATAAEPNQITLNGQLNTTRLEFSPANWNIPQKVTVIAVDDDVVEGDQSIIILHMTDCSDPNFNAYAGAVSVLVLDNEVPHVEIVESDDSTIVEEQGPTSDTYTVRLTSVPPTDNVTIAITTDGQTTVAPASLIFTPATWNTPQYITVTAVDDDVFEGEHTSTITHTVTSLDGGYDGLKAGNVIARVMDNECGAWGFHLMDFDHNCIVDIADLAEFAASWLDCTQPYYENCIDLR